MSVQTIRQLFSHTNYVTLIRHASLKQNHHDLGRYKRKKTITRTELNTNLDLPWKRSTKQHCLSHPTWRHVHLFNNLSDLGFKTHPASCQLHQELRI